MELSKKERLAFIYQLQILEALYPDEASDYAAHRIALEKGFTLQYSWMFEHLYEELSEKDCQEVLDILDMYRSITFALESLDANNPLRKHHLAIFAGFDGNNESHQMAYVRYFIVDLDRFTELRRGDYPSFNSHCPMLDTYRAMLQRWQSIPARSRFKLSEQQLSLVLGAE